MHLNGRGGLATSVGRPPACGCVRSSAPATAKCCSLLVDELARSYDGRPATTGTRPARSHPHDHRPALICKQLINSGNEVSVRKMSNQGRSLNPSMLFRTDIDPRGAVQEQRRRPVGARTIRPALVVDSLTRRSMPPQAGPRLGIP